MGRSAAVDRASRKRVQVVSTKYPVSHTELLDKVAKDEGHRSRSGLIRKLLNEKVREHFPSALTELNGGEEK